MKIKLISNIPIFSSCKVNCLRQIATTLEQMHFSPGESIISKGDLSSEMYIIGHGIVEVIIKDGKVASTLQTGQFFGEIGLLREVPRGAEVRARSYCDIYRLKRDDFLPIMEKNDRIFEEIKQIINKRSTDSRTKDKR